MEGYKFIAGAVCPSCKEQDSIVLKDDDSEVKCISCNYFELKNDKDLGSIKIIALDSSSSISSPCPAARRYTTAKEALDPLGSFP